MSALNYNAYVSALANLLVVPSTDSNFVAMLPNIINDAEQRIYREMDFLSTVSAVELNNTTPNNPQFGLPIPAAGPFVVLQSVNILRTTDSGSPFQQVVPASLEMIYALWPSPNAPTSPSYPQYFGMITDQLILFGPPPDSSYPVQLIGTIRPLSLSSSNAATTLSVTYPDLFLAASMVFASGYLKNYGAAVDDPKMAITWESHYQELAKSAQTEIARQKFTQGGWSSKQPSPQVTPPRT